MMPVSYSKIVRQIAAILFCGVFVIATYAEEPTAAETHGRDVLVFKDGDRVQGHLVEQNADTIVFQSDRFGTLHIAVGNAVVIKSSKPTEKVASQSAKPAAAPTATTPAPNLQTAAERAEAEKVSVWDWFSPAVLTAKMANFFGPWHGRVAFSTEVVSDTAERNNVALEGSLTRKFKNDEVQLKGRYDYSKTNELTTTDLVKGDGLWRHTFPRLWFAQYRPTFEWNRASFDKVTGAPTDYFLAQQEIGIGRSLISTATRKIRVGISENLFDLWNTTTGAQDSHSSRAVESAFLETEFKLPWRMSLTQRAVYYYSIASATDGWENQIELTKKFTETLSTSIRHEIRRDNPDGRAPDYTRLKLLLGLDF